MGSLVEVDSDDIEALLFGTGALKSIESVLRDAKSDPFAAKSRARFTEAHDRVAQAWRGAGRRVAHPERFTDVTAEEIRALQRYWPRREHEPWARFVPQPIDGDSFLTDQDGVEHAAEVFLHNGERRAHLRALLVRGLVEFGAERVLVHWGTTGDVTDRATPVQWVRPTPRAIGAVLHAEGEPPDE